MSTKKDVELRSESSMSEKLETTSQSQKPLLLNYILCQLENKPKPASIKDFESWEQLANFYNPNWRAQALCTFIVDHKRANSSLTNRLANTP
ncbi:unnamed protein product [Pieris macdunnoughi]|uniref:Uncharacterized protein n=1 Tax=Pieris macdunnoughi TaxID=345717 RepID=A0A821V2I8_9NEOP|nr:unnamed protein product [Pieris macdunnoughi]